MKKHKLFTLTEILIALAIASICIGSALTIAGKNSRLIIQNEQRWAKSHLLSLVCEYWLLVGPEVDLPDDLLPMDYSASCEVELLEFDDDEGIEMPEAAFGAISGWRLGRYTITLFKKGEEVSQQEVFKIVKEVDHE